MTPQIKQFVTESKPFQFLKEFFVTLFVLDSEFPARPNEVFLPDELAKMGSSLSGAGQQPQKKLIEQAEQKPPSKMRVANPKE